MGALPQPGEYMAAGLIPDNYELFSAWLFLRLMHNHQPEAYRDGFTEKTVKILMEHDERRADILVPTLLSALPPSMDGAIRRRFGDDAADTIRELGRHAATAFNYIDQASPTVQKIALAVRMGLAAKLKTDADDILRQLNRLQDDVDAGEAGDSKLNVSTLMEPRGFYMTAYKTQGKTGNERLEDGHLHEVIDYDDFRKLYLQQLMSVELLSAKSRANISAKMQEHPTLPRFDETIIMDTPVTKAAYNHIILDSRLSPVTVMTALRASEALSTAENVAPETIAAALLGMAMPSITSYDAAFLRQSVSGDVVDLIRECEAVIKAGTELPDMPLAVRQMAAADALIQLRDGEKICRRAELVLATMMEQGNVRMEHIVDSVENTFGTVLAVEHGMMPYLAMLDAPTLAEDLRAQLERTMAVTRPLGERMKEYLENKQQGGTAPRRRGGPGL